MEKNEWRQAFFFLSNFIVKTRGVNLTKLLQVPLLFLDSKTTATLANYMCYDCSLIALFGAVNSRFCSDLGSSGWRSKTGVAYRCAHKVIAFTYP